VKPRFHRNQTRARWGDLDARDRTRAALLHAFLGGARANPDLDRLLGRTARYAIRRGRGIRAEWWQVGDAGLMFDVGTARIVGEARDGDFAMRDRLMWGQLIDAVSRPRKIDWAVDARKPSWKASATPARLVRAVAELAGEPKPKQTRGPSYKAGDPVQILYASRWYPGLVTAKNAAGYRVTYIGFDASWNSTVTRDRLRPRIPDAAASAYAIGDRVEIAYGNDWFAGTITKVAPRKRYGITYTGWDSGWDEVVGMERLRLPTR
jgi:hypothetical protein